MVQSRKVTIYLQARIDWNEVYHLMAGHETAIQMMGLAMKLENLGSIQILSVVVVGCFWVL